ncbi:MAG TPA: PD-(D/E)XK nuclease family protein, partial [Limnochordia bacterium]
RSPLEAWSPSAIEATLDAIVAELAPQLGHEILLSSAHHRYLTLVLRRTLGRAVSVLLAHARAGRFRPLAVELQFGPEGRLPPLELQATDGTRLRLVGQIDRLEIARSDGQTWLRVIDYKSGSAAFRLEEVYHGLTLQLPAYMAVLVEAAASEAGAELLGGGEPRPAAILLFASRDPRLRVDGPLSAEEVAARRLRQLRMHGLLIDDQAVLRMMDADAQGHSALIPAYFRKDGALGAGSSTADAERWDALLAHTRRRLLDLARAILAGEIAPRPFLLRERRACTHCGLRPVCRFDPLVPGYRYRALEPLSTDAAWTAIGQSEGEPV